MQTSVFAAQYHEASDSSKNPSFLLFLPLLARGRRIFLIPASILKADAAGGVGEAGDL